MTEPLPKPDMVAHRVSQKDLNVALELDEIINNANDTNFPILRVEFWIDEL